MTATIRSASSAASGRSKRSRLLVRALRVIAARHHDDELRARGEHGIPRDDLGALAGEAEHILAAGQLDHLRGPVAGDEDRVEPLERDDARARLLAHGELDAVDARGDIGDQLDAALARAGRLGERAHVAERLAERMRVERDHARIRRQLTRDLGDVVIGDGADGAERLRDDHLRRELGERVAVELVDRLAGERALANGGVDRGGVEARRQHVARDPRPLKRLQRIVALVRDGDDVIAEPEREEQFGRVRHEADDSHATHFTLAMLAGRDGIAQ